MFMVSFANNRFENECARDDHANRTAHNPPTPSAQVFYSHNENVSRLTENRHHARRGRDFSTESQTPGDHCQGTVELGNYYVNPKDGQRYSAWRCVRCGCVWSLLGFRLLQPGPDCPVHGKT